jgi:hypothetical protein
MDEATRERMHDRAFLSSLQDSNRYNTINPALKRWAIIATLAISPASHDAPNEAYWVRIAARNYKYAAPTALAHLMHAFFRFAAGIRAPPASKKQTAGPHQGPGRCEFSRILT